MRDLTDSPDKRVDEQAYAGFHIRLTDRWMFAVPELNQTFGSLRQAKEAVDAHLQAQAAEKRAEANKALRLPVLLDSGDAATITGVNARTGTLNGIKDESYVYPPAPWVENALKAKAAALARVREIEQQLRWFSIYARSGYGGRIDAANYDNAVERVKANYEQAQKKLAAAPVPQEWA